jgi:hypothetical protein
MSNKKKNTKDTKQRNWLAVHAFQRSGAGTHGDEKKKRNKNKCRKRVQIPRD